MLDLDPVGLQGERPGHHAAGRAVPQVDDRCEHALAGDHDRAAAEVAADRAGPQVLERGLDPLRHEAGVRRRALELGPVGELGRHPGRVAHAEGSRRPEAPGRADRDAVLSDRQAAERRDAVPAAVLAGGDGGAAVERDRHLAERRARLGGDDDIDSARRHAAGGRRPHDREDRVLDDGALAVAQPLTVEAGDAIAGRGVVDAAVHEGLGVDLLHRAVLDEAVRVPVPGEQVIDTVVGEPERGLVDHGRVDEGGDRHAAAVGQAAVDEAEHAVHVVEEREVQDDEADAALIEAVLARPEELLVGDLAVVVVVVAHHRHEGHVEPGHDVEDGLERVLAGVVGDVPGHDEKVRPRLDLHRQVEGPTHVDHADAVAHVRVRRVDEAHVSRRRLADEAQVDRPGSIGDGQRRPHRRRLEAVGDARPEDAVRRQVEAEVPVGAAVRHQGGLDPDRHAGHGRLVAVEDPVPVLIDVHGALDGDRRGGRCLGGRHDDDQRHGEHWPASISRAGGHN